MPVIQGVGAAATGFKAASIASEKLAGYDFVGLLTRIGIFYIVALIIAKIFEAMVAAEAGIQAAAKLFGVPLPTHVPEPIRKLFVEGYNVGGITIKWWDFIKILSVLLVVYEMIQFMEDKKSVGQKAAPTTIGVFVLIIAGLSVVSFGDIYQMIKEKQVISR